ncbi:hypothetical protein QJS10_CPA16g01626 [Acorus calamus]|uniref:Reverse transcriptase zinc-binding domain-containing protein n=1 Tax=Acorus calamus TaxID=4465 RepID=A0AAV9D2R5_ACOCL|nr:hypothetical protein QJS10_CPA16g01626 [Acorus calamus]
MSFISRGWFALGEEFLSALRWQIGKGDRVLFWADRWCSDEPLKTAFPRVYRVANNRDSTVQQCWSSEGAGGGNWQLHLRRITAEAEVTEVANLLLLIQEKVLQPEREDVLAWASNPDEPFKVKECYKWWRRESVEVTDMVDQTKWIWKRKVPLKVKIFMWLAFQDCLLTKVYRARWRPAEGMTCELCNAAPESVDHLFGQCPAVAALWGLIGAATGIHTEFHSRDEMWQLMKSYSRLGGSRLHARVLKTVIPAALWAIWLARNKRIFAGHRFYVENIWEDTMGLVAAWGRALAGAGDVRIVRGEIQVDPG